MLSESIEFRNAARTIALGRGSNELFAQAQKLVNVEFGFGPIQQVVIGVELHGKVYPVQPILTILSWSVPYELAQYRIRISPPSMPARLLKPPSAIAAPSSVTCR